MSVQSDLPTGISTEAALLGNAKSAMFAAIEVHNKPIFPYRYEVCTLLAINAWELALKTFIAKDIKSVNLIKRDGTAKPFAECIACVSSDLGKSFEPIKHNLEILYEYRNKIAHFYSGEMDVIVLGLLKASVIFFVQFVEERFGERLYEEANLILLPIGFKKPVSPLDFISNHSAAKQCSPEVKAFLQRIKKSSEALQSQGIDESVIVNYSIALVNETRIKNADLTAAINNASPNVTMLAIHNVISAAQFTNDPSARQVRLSEDSVFSSIFTETYADVLRTARLNFGDFVQNARFNRIMNELKKDPNVTWTRLLNPRNPNGGKKDFYSKRIYDELAKHYTAFPVDSSIATKPQLAH
jgi:Protein of unknown function (DUF3644)/EC042_2821-lke REase